MSLLDQHGMSFLHQLDVPGLALRALHASEVNQVVHVLPARVVVHTGAMSCSVGGFLLTDGALASVGFPQFRQQLLLLINQSHRIVDSCLGCFLPLPDSLNRW